MRYYLRVQTFALGSDSGGCWEPARIYSSTCDYDECYKQAFNDCLAEGFAFKREFTICDKDGEDFQ